MKDLILADVIRILRKPSYRIMMVVAHLLALSVAIRTRLNVWNGFTYVSNQATMQGIAAEMLLGIMIYLSVYADEFTSNSMQALIGHGVSRFKLILAKFINCVIITFISFISYTIFVQLLGLIMGAKMTGEEAGFLASQTMVGAVHTIGYATIAMIVLYLTKNVIFSTLTDIVLMILKDIIANGIQKIPVLKFLHLENKLFAGAVDIANASFMLGHKGAAFTIIWELVKVCAVSILISYLIFRKKELDF